MPTLNYDPTDRKLKERIFHALCFESIAIVICAPLLATLLNKSVTATGVLTIMTATIAMLWNIVYNILFDRASRKLSLLRSARIRLIHALLFELGLIVILVPLAAWWLSVSLFTAFIMEIGLILFFLPYTMFYSWLYDYCRNYLWLRKNKQNGEQTAPQNK